MNHRDLIGIPFVSKGRDPAIGLDCWGLVMAAMRKYGREVPDFDIACDDSKEIDGAYLLNVSRVEKIPGPEEGAIVAFSTDPHYPDTVNHFGVCIGEGCFLHTLKKINSCRMRFDSPLWTGKTRGFYRWIG